jgi:hypothetical protein
MLSDALAANPQQLHIGFPLSLLAWPTRHTHISHLPLSLSSFSLSLLPFFSPDDVPTYRSWQRGHVAQTCAPGKAGGAFAMRVGGRAHGKVEHHGTGQAHGNASDARQHLRVRQHPVHGKDCPHGNARDARQRGCAVQHGRGARQRQLCRRRHCRETFAMRCHTAKPCRM